MFNIPLDTIQGMDVETLLENMSFLGTVYDFRVLMWGFGVLMMLDMVLKGWGMWRAAKMGKKMWFITLLLVNSIGIVPLFFLKLTNKEYKALQASGVSTENLSPQQGDTAL